MERERAIDEVCSDSRDGVPRLVERVMCTRGRLGGWLMLRYAPCSDCQKFIIVNN